METCKETAIISLLRSNRGGYKLEKQNESWEYFNRFSYLGFALTRVYSKNVEKEPHTFIYK